jgi:hypothetical protein
MTEGREDGNWDQALSSHQDMQSEIITGRNIELYDRSYPSILTSQRKRRTTKANVKQQRTPRLQRQSELEARRFPRELWMASSWPVP